MEGMHNKSAVFLKYYSRELIVNNTDRWQSSEQAVEGRETWRQAEGDPTRRLRQPSCPSSRSTWRVDSP